MKSTLSAALRALALTACGIYCHAGHAASQCSLWKEGGYPYNLTYDLPATIVLPADRYDWTQDGAGTASTNILAHARIDPANDPRIPVYPSDTSAKKPYIFCDGATPLGTLIGVTEEVRLEGLGEPIPGTFIYRTGVAGVGIQVRMGATGNWLPLSTTMSTVSGQVDGRPAFYWSVQWFRFEFVAIAKTPQQGDVELGVTRPATLTVTYKQSGGPDMRVLNLTIPPVRIIRGSCTVPDTNVAMGRIQLSEFDSSDAPARAGRDFQINLSCNGATKMTYAITSNHVQQASLGILALDSTPISARNVGLQIQDETGTPLNFNVEQPANGVPLTTTAGSFPLKFRAQYRRLQPGAISPGLANATATITMKYR